MKQKICMNICGIPTPTSESGYIWNHTVYLLPEPCIEAEVADVTPDIV
jgi:hypothetical protein